MSGKGASGLVTRRVLPASTLIYFYRRRLRAHGVQELLAGVGIAAAVALVLAANVAQSSITSSTREVQRSVIGPASLQLRARGPEGLPETTLKRVESIPGVKQAAPLLERSVEIRGPSGKEALVYLAGTDASLAVLNGLGKTLPLNALRDGTVAVTSTSASATGVHGTVDGSHARVTLAVGGRSAREGVSAVLGPGDVGALAGAQVGVMPLTSMQRLLGEPGRISRVLVQTAPGTKARVRRELQQIAGTTLLVSGAEQDITELEQALKPSAQASALFAVIGALLGLLFAFNAILLTVPERRRAIADLRLAGTRRAAIVQLQFFQAVCLGAAASAVGVLIGYALSRWVFHQSTGYLRAAFTTSPATVLGGGSVVAAWLGGVLATWLASTIALGDLRRAEGPIGSGSEPGANTLSLPLRAWMAGAALALGALAFVLYVAVPAAAVLASGALALATVLAVPVVFAAVVAGARALSERRPKLSTLALALGGVRGTSLRALALAATGAVALFGSVALGGARSNLLDGIHGFAEAYAADAPIWVGEAEDNQATGRLADPGVAEQLQRVRGVASVQGFQGTFLSLGRRRVWVIARPPGGARRVLDSQTIGGEPAAREADARLAEGGWVAISEQIAKERHKRVGDTITLPTPSGPATLRIAALTTNLAWSPGVIFIGTGDYTRAWRTSAPSALAVTPSAGADTQEVADSITAALGPVSGLRVVSAAEREQRIDELTREGLSQLGLISTLLVIAAILALAAATASSIHQRRRALAALRLAGAPPARLRRILLLEGALMLGSGCLIGAIAGIGGQFVIDAYLRHITGFPVAPAGASVRPLEIFATVLVVALAIVAIPGWRASRVPPSLALAEE